jgi:hypothetical protein
MSIGQILFLIAAILLFLAGIGTTVVPNPTVWALFCLALGLLLEGMGFALPRRR